MLRTSPAFDFRLHLKSNIFLPSYSGVTLSFDGEAIPSSSGSDLSLILHIQVWLRGLNSAMEYVFRFSISKRPPKINNLSWNATELADMRGLIVPPSMLNLLHIIVDRSTQKKSIVAKLAPLPPRMSRRRWSMILWSKKSHAWVMTKWECG